jgi:hypothetical protein
VQEAQEIFFMIPKPNLAEVRRYLIKWRDEPEDEPEYVSQEKSLRKLFTKTYPLNTDLDDVLIKVCSLNAFYSTNIFSLCTVAKHIVSLNIDEKLQNKDLNLVNQIAAIKMENGRKINFYSFATKYCSHHFPADYPIFDSFVEKMLLHFQKADSFSKFSKADLKVYPEYKRILVDFQSYYGLAEYNLKEIDQYLWLAGKKHFKEPY